MKPHSLFPFNFDPACLLPVVDSLACTSSVSDYLLIIFCLWFSYITLIYV